VTGKAHHSGLRFPFHKQGDHPMFSKIAAAVAAFFIASASFAADIPTKAPAAPSFQYPSVKCGLYYGVNTGGSTSAVNNAAVGTQIVQGEIGATIGYTCPVGPGFWFVDGDLDFSNLNGGSSNGFNLTGNGMFTERFGFGAPLNMITQLIPNLTSLQNAVPSLIPLPTGVNVVTSFPYLFGALHQDDVGNQNGLQPFKQYLFSAGLGIGTKIRLSNGVVFDPSAEYVLPGSRVCVGPAAFGCISEGAGFRIVSRLEW
jgi:hypothetical protein